jgi:hypothetical protein
MARIAASEQSEQPPTLDQIRAALVESRARWDVIRLLEQIPMSLSTIYAVMGGKPVGADTLRFFERWYHDHGRRLDAPPLPTEEETRAHLEAVRASVAAGSVLETAKALNVTTDAVARLLTGCWPRWSVHRKLRRWYVAQSAGVDGAG